ncbi:MAG: endolytic transglycosylase MltG [Ktedonobacteraceae bacterium]|nr:endolytic transglycosylase MltG [Ktedonobacteraceae bacterium]
MKKSGGRLALLSVILLGLIIFGIVYYAWNTTTDVFQPASSDPNSKPIAFSVEKGDTTAQIAERLQQKGLIRNALAFRLWARIKGLDTKLQAGVYTQLKPNMTISQIIDKLLEAQPDATRVLVQEGLRLEEIARRYANASPKLIKFNSDEFLKYTQHIDQFPDAGKYPLLKLVPPAYHTMEGLLFPATYDVPINANARDVVNMMLKKMTNVIEQYNLEKLGQDHRLDLYHVLILASIIQREALFDSDRGNIASVYWNRIFRPNTETVSKLQADPTVQYARDTQKPPEQGGKFWSPLNDVGGNIVPDSPYNTYTHQGWPPTPICTSGLISMQAAAQPPVTNYYFFLNKKDGHAVFAENAAKFEQLKKQYL